MAQGIPKDAIYNLTMDEASLMWRGWETGAYGSLGDSLRNYQLYVQLHYIRENFISANKKNYKSRKPAEFKEYDHLMANFLGMVENNSHDPVANRELQDRIFNMFGEADASNNTNERISGS